MRTAVTEALTDIRKEGRKFYEAEIHRLIGELILRKWARDWELGTAPFSTIPKSQPQDPRVAVLEAEGYFRKAIDVAQKQHAKSLELRATVSLARLWQQQALGQRAKSKAGREEVTEQESRNTPHETRNKLTEAHTMLSDIYNWFTEGFDTKDLQEAKELLEELQRG